MKGSNIMVVFGVIQLLVGTLMLRRALSARARLSPWRGQLMIACSSVVLGATWMLSRGQVAPAVGVASLGCIVGFVVGSVVSLREGKRVHLGRRDRQEGA